MNGAQHYAEAERLLELAANATCANHEGENPEGALIIAEAQVHATLAQVAATIDAAAWVPRLIEQQWRTALKKSDES